LKPSILDYTQDELGEMIPPKFRAKQIFNWIYQQHVDNFSQMENIPKKLRNELDERFVLSPLKIVQKQQSSDGSVKYLFGLRDGHTVEAVLLKMKDAQYDEKGELIHHAKYTVCVSTQVGCKVGCAFCLTAKGGFIRNLTAQPRQPCQGYQDIRQREWTKYLAKTTDCVNERYQHEDQKTRRNGTRCAVGDQSARR